MFFISIHYLKIRDITFPNDGKFQDLKYFVKSLLHKKSNHRNCSFNKIKSDECSKLERL